DELPAFTTPTSGLPVPHRVEDASEVARIVAAGRALGATQGTLVTVPVPAADGLPKAEIDAALDAALRDAAAEGLSGAAVTPFVLGRIAEATEGRSVPANLALAENNARVAASIAVELARRDGGT